LTKLKLAPVIYDRVEIYGHMMYIF